MRGANAAIVGFTAGLGELFGYGFRSITGFISGRTGRYWFKARAAYNDFLTLWKDVDPDIPVLKQAKAEYRKLQ
jgi:hypothetical protein